jgi:hypothetical protein
VCSNPAKVPVTCVEAFAGVHDTPTHHVSSLRMATVSADDLGEDMAWEWIQDILRPQRTMIAAPAASSRQRGM